MALNLRPLARTALQKIQQYRYHQRQVNAAFYKLQGIEADKGKTCPNNIKLCNEYSIDVLGQKHFAPWLYVYSAVSGGFKEGWIPDNYYGAIVIPNITGAYGASARLKPLNSSVFQSEVFPDLLSYTHGIFFDTAYKFLAPETIKDHLFKDHDKVVFKQDNTLQGLGIHVFDCDTFSVQKIAALGNGLFQGFIQQHALFNEFANNSVATLRITTFYEDDGTISIRGCNLRLGTGSDTHVQSKSQIEVPIDLASGAFHVNGYTPGWIEVQRHPTSKVGFSGKTIPAFDECIRTVTELHKKVPYARCVGWDVTVDANENVKLIEWNAGHNGIKTHEATQGPCFADLGWEKLRNEPNK